MVGWGGWCVCVQLIEFHFALPSQKVSLEKAGPPKEEKRRQKGKETKSKKGKWAKYGEKKGQTGPLTLLRGFLAKTQKEEEPAGRSPNKKRKIHSIRFRQRQMGVSLSVYRRFRAVRVLFFSFGVHRQRLPFFLTWLKNASRGGLVCLFFFPLPFFFFFLWFFSLFFFFFFCGNCPF
jgi:hypothetical protein